MSYMVFCVSQMSCESSVAGFRLQRDITIRDSLVQSLGSVLIDSQSVSTDLKAGPKFFQGSSAIFLENYLKLPYNFSSSSKIVENFTKFPSKSFFKSQYEVFPIFLKVFQKFLCSFFIILMKLFQKNFLKFLHSINNINSELLQLFPMMFS